MLRFLLTIVICILVLMVPLTRGEAGNLPCPLLTPTSPVYPLLRTSERIRFFFTPPAGRAPYRLAQATRRLEEAEHVLASDQADLAQVLLTESYLFVLDSIYNTPAIGTPLTATDSWSRLRELVSKTRQIIREML